MRYLFIADENSAIPLCGYQDQYTYLIQYHEDLDLHISKWAGIMRFIVPCIQKFIDLAQPTHFDFYIL